MIRRLLPPAPDETLTALDAALLQGDFVLARQILQARRAQPGLPARHVQLRSLALDYLSLHYASLTGRIRQLVEAGGGLAEAEAGLAGAAYFLLALTCIDQGREEEGLAALEISGVHLANDPGAETYLALARAQLALYSNRYDEAEAHLAALEPQLGKGEDGWEEGQWLRLRGLLYHQQSTYDQALACLQEARARFVALQDAYEAARCDKALANTYRRLEQAGPARRSIEQAIAYFQAQELAVPLGRCQNTLGAIQFYFNQHAQALETLHGAAAALEEAGLRLEAAHTLSNLARTHHSLGQIRSAFHCLDRARGLIAQPDRPDIDATLAETRARLQWEQGRSEEALENLRHAAQTFAHLGAVTQAAIAWRIQGEYLRELGRSDEAETLLERSRRLFLAQERPAPAAECAMQLARIHLQRGEVAQARVLLQEAGRVLRQHKHEQRAATAAIWLGQAHLAAGEIEPAEDCFHQALAGVPLRRIEEGWRGHQGLAEIARGRGEGDRARQHLQEAVREVNRLRLGAPSPQAAARLAAESQPLYEGAIDLALAQDRVEAAFLLAERQKSLQLVQELRPSALSRQDRAPTAAEGGLGQRLEQLDGLHAAILAATREGQWSRVEALERQFQHLVEEFAILHAPHAALYAPPPLDLAQLCGQLDRRHGAGAWACLSYAWLGDSPARLHRFWLDSEGLQAAPVALQQQTRHWLDLACRPEPSYRRRLLGRRQAGSDPMWAALQALMLPADFAARLQGVETLYVLPSGPLASFPFAALALGDSHLGLRLNLSQIPSLALMQAMLGPVPAAGPPPLAAMEALICAVSHFPGHAQAPDLPGVVAEAEHLAARVAPGSLLLREGEATHGRLLSLRDEGKLEQYKLLHFATHTRFNPAQAALSAILLHEGELLLHDILTWRLQADLVVLAACDTAVGHVHAGDEQMGLPHAFLIAGARSLLASLWPVDDALAATFLAAFYQALAAEGGHPSRALTMARQAVAESGALPLAWGAFTLIGLS